MNTSSRKFLWTIILFGYVGPIEVRQVYLLPKIIDDLGIQFS